METPTALDGRLPIDADAPPILDPKLVLAEVMAATARGALLMEGIQEQANIASAKRAEIEQRAAEVEQAKSKIELDIKIANELVAQSQQNVEQVKAVTADVSALLGTAQTLATQAAETNAQATAALEAIRATATNASDAASRAEGLKIQIEQNAEVAAQRSQHIEDGRQYVDGKRAEIDVVMNRAQQAATTAEAQYQASRATSENLNALYLTAQTTKANIDLTAEAIAIINKQCVEHATIAKGLADIATTTEAKVKAYEARLAELDVLAAARLKTIESLLPGATSAGLAAAFGQRRAHYKWPQRIWQWVFVLSVLALLGLAYEFPSMAKDAPLNWERLGSSLLHRLPFALPLIWLAFHASHKAALSQRVEEDYAFKETISRSFEGYRREMAELEGKVAPDSPLGRLCADTLSVIARRPGLIYEKHPLNKTPLNALAESMAPIAEAAAKMPPVKLGA